MVDRVGAIVVFDLKVRRKLIGCPQQIGCFGKSVLQRYIIHIGAVGMEGYSQGRFITKLLVDINLGSELLIIIVFYHSFLIKIAE